MRLGPDPARLPLLAFLPDARLVYRAAAGITDEHWERGKGRVLEGVVGLAYYRHTNATLVNNIVRAIDAVLVGADR